MNKTELIEQFAAATNMSKAAAGDSLNALTGIITKALTAKDSVTIVGFGTFSTSKRAARTGRNPKTGATLKIAATVVPKFKAGNGLKEAVQGKKAGAKAAKAPAKAAAKK
jgi:DNA-binding protein HU-beta